MEKKYQIFISSTFEDLKVERKRIQDEILRMNQFPVEMEHLSTANTNQWEAIKKAIDNSDYYVLIIGNRMGPTIKEGRCKGMSYAEKEFTYATNKDIPVFAFIIDDSAARTDDRWENTLTAQINLRHFIKKVKADHYVERWKSTDDLAFKVVNSLRKEFLRNNRPGWIRNGKTNFSISDMKDLVLKKVSEIKTKSPLEIIKIIKTEIGEAYRIIAQLFFE